MKKFIILISIAALLLGLRLYDNGLLSINQEGKYTVYGKSGTETVYISENKPLLDRFGAYTRLDTEGDMGKALQGLEDLSAKILWTENIGEDITIIYAYSPYINKCETVSGKTVNIMIAVSNGNIAYGCPLLKGSY